MRRSWPAGLQLKAVAGVRRPQRRRRYGPLVGIASEASYVSKIAVSLSTCFDSEGTADRDVRPLRVHGRRELDRVHVEAGLLEPLLRQHDEFRLVREHLALRRQEGLAARVGQ